MKTNAASRTEQDKERPRWELLLLLLALLSSLCFIFGSTETALGFWPERINSSLLSTRQADYTGGPSGSRFAVFDPGIGPEAATDIARLQITPTGEEGGVITFFPIPTPLTPTPQPKLTPQPATPGRVTPAATANSTPTARVDSTPTTTVDSTPTVVPTARITAQPTSTPAQTAVPGPPTATSPASPLSTPLPLPSNTPLPDDDDDDDEDDDDEDDDDEDDDDDDEDDDDEDDDDDDDDGGFVPTPTNTPLPAPTFTPTFTPTPTPTNTPAAVLLSGRVFEDTDYSGGGGTAFGGGDAGLPNVTVELYDGLTLLASVATDDAGAYTFSNVPSSGTFTVRAVSFTIGDLDTPPTNRFNSGFSRSLAEQTYENDGVAGNGETGALGGDDPLVDDTATAPGAGPGDTNVTVTTAGLDVTGVDLGFAFNLVVNTANFGQGSLQQAIDNANAISGVDTIVFNIPGPPPYTIRPDPALRAVSDPVIIDGTTQPGFAGGPIVELDGTNATAPNSAGLKITAGGSTIRGLVINRFANWVGIELNGNGANIIQGNYIGTDVAGAAALPNVSGVYMTNGSSGNQIGGPNPADRNVISGNQNYNIMIDDGANGNKITGNYLGPDAAGLASLGGLGVHIRDASNTIIGGTTPGERNIISGNDSRGVLLNWNTSGNVIQGNYIGVTTGLTPLGNSTGIYFLNGANNNLIGGPAPNQANIIAYNTPEAGILFGTSAGGDNRIVGNAIYANGEGIRFDGGPTAIDNQITQNSIYTNAGLGIDLTVAGTTGVTENDDGDIDGGPNDLLNFPVITRAVHAGSVITVTGFAPPGSTVEFFLADSDPSGFGEGQTFLGAFVEDSPADTDPAANVFYDFGPPIGSDTANRFSFTFTPTVSVNPGAEITATATDPTGSTSEFGPNEPVN